MTGLFESLWHSDPVEAVFIGVAFLCLAIVVLVTAVCRVSPILFFKVRRADIDITAIDLMQLRINGVDPSILMQAVLKAHEHGLKPDIKVLLEHSLCGGNPGRVIDALKNAKTSGTETSLKDLCKAELRGEDLR